MYFSCRLVMVMVRLVGLLMFSGFGWLWLMLQNGQCWVQMLFMIMKVVVLLEKYLFRFGQDVFLQMLCSLCLCSSCLMWLILGEIGMCMWIQLGFFGSFLVGMIFIGICVIFFVLCSFMLIFILFGLVFLDFFIIVFMLV